MCSDDESFVVLFGTFYAFLDVMNREAFTNEKPKRECYQPKWMEQEEKDDFDVRGNRRHGAFRDRSGLV